ncbi:MAG: FHA domain-containing protein [Proteobacteria bacterium]|nr:FHA domain-containing protein [Pseudomonadota bacterium]
MAYRPPHNLDPASVLADTDEEAGRAIGDIEGVRTTLDGPQARKRPSGRPGGPDNLDDDDAHEDERKTIERPVSRRRLEWDDRTSVDDTSSDSSVDDRVPLDESTLDDHKSLSPAAVHSPASPTDDDDPATAKLVVVSGKNEGSEFELFGKSISIGRGLDNDVVLTDIAVSREHLTLKYDGIHYRLLDHGSGNGTYINDEIETGSSVLADGDQIEIGETIIRFEHPSARQGVGKPRGLATAETLPGGPFGEIAKGMRGSQRVEFQNSNPVRLPAPAFADSERPRAPLPSPAPLPPLMADTPAPILGRSSAHESVQSLSGRDSLSSSAKNPALATAETVPGRGDLLGDALARDTGGTTAPQLAFADPSSALLTGSKPNLLDVVAPYPATAPTDQTARRRGMLIGLLVFLLFVAAAAGGTAFVVRSQGQQASAADPAGTGQDVPELPRDTWGTDETLLVAAAGGAALPADSAPASASPTSSARSSERVGTSDSSPGDRGDGDSVVSVAVTIPSQSPVAEPDRVAPASDRPDPIENSARPAPKTRPVQQKGRSPSRNRRVVEARARKSAQDQYRARKFNVASKILRSAAGDLSAKQGAKLRTMAANYQRVAGELRKGKQLASSKPIDAMRSYERALRLDKRYGRGAHSWFIRTKLTAVTPRAAAAYMSRKSYEAAKETADKAAQYGASSNSAVKRIRQQLERKASELFKNGLRIERTRPDEARRLYTRVLKIVPPSSSWHQKARKRL